MILAKKQTIPMIERAFNSENIDVKIEVKFEHMRLKDQKQTAILYHNNRFEQLYRVMNHNSKFIFGNKALIMINITNYLKLDQYTSSRPYNRKEF